MVAMTGDATNDASSRRPVTEHRLVDRADADAYGGCLRTESLLFLGNTG
jgi:hypothetical protein